MEHSPEVTVIVNKLNFAQCTYLLSVHRLETLRVSNAVPTSFAAVFSYLEDKAIIKDKAGMWQCLLASFDKVFDMFLDIKAKMVRFLLYLIKYQGSSLFVFPKTYVTKYNRV